MSRPTTPLLPSLALFALALHAGAPALAQTDEEIEALVQAERDHADYLRRHGDLRGAQSDLRKLLDEEPEDPATRTLLALVLRDQTEYEPALEEAGRALAEARELEDPQLVAACARNLADVLLILGRADEALGVLEPDPGQARFLDPTSDARDALVLGRALEAVGDREAAQRAFRMGLEARRDAAWDVMLAKGRCEWALGRLTDASRSIVMADRTARSGAGEEAEVLAALGRLYFESEREVEAPGKRSAGELFKDALDLCPLQEEATLALFELHRYNRQRRSRSPEEILSEFLTARPASVAGWIGNVSADLFDGDLRGAREGLAKLDGLAPARREVRTLHAALAWVEHRREDCERILAELATRHPADGRPEREVGRTLIELYRFAEAVPFLQRAAERDATDWEAWTYLGRALANVGREDEARDALDKARNAAEGRQDAWRNNTSLVLERIRREHVVEDFGDLDFSWMPDAADVLRVYMVPFYERARADQAQRYGYTPGETLIQVFRRHGDFSVRSVGFEGFPALGVCFGPVVTALSPLSELRGSFNWARTGFHEFSHVVHLGLSHNRCPRWITEGLATWEEEHLNPSWTRNMRRELKDSLANDDLIAVRDLNRAFRGPRILFGYYQGGLLCRMLIDRFGFPPMIRLLEAFDRGLDLDQALREVFDTTPEDLDAQFRAFVANEVRDLGVEPRWSSGRLARLRLTLAKDLPADESARAEWAEGWTTVAWGSWQRGRRLDAEEALRRVAQAGDERPRALFLRGEMALEADDVRGARELWRRAVDLGGRDYRALIGLGSIELARGNADAAEELFLQAERAFPGYDDVQLSAELRQAELYANQAREDDEMAARERWLAWNPGDYDTRMLVARWHAGQGRFERAAQLFEQANEVDPFRRDLHRSWATALMALGRWQEALRELEVTMLVPPQHDLDHQRPAQGTGPDAGESDAGDPKALPPHAAQGMGADERVGIPLTPPERAELLRDRARCLRELGDDAKAAEEEARAAELDAGG